MINPIDTIKRRGIVGTFVYTKLFILKKLGWYRFFYRDVPQYIGPSEHELQAIERELISVGIQVDDYIVDKNAFITFKSKQLFPDNYYGRNGFHVREEKLLEHFIASDRLKLFDFSEDDVYVDIAACDSPWVQALRTRLGINAYAIDLKLNYAYESLDYYRQENATATLFDRASVQGASLQCAYEMFKGQDDIDFIKEASRILAPDGKIVIVPFYMHTHYCAYSTPEFWGKGYADVKAKEYIYHDSWGVHSSRKYDVVMLTQRLINTIKQHGLQYRLLVLRNKQDLGKNIYCHFILEILK